LEFLAPGKQAEAIEVFRRISLLIAEVSVYSIEWLKYILYLARVFKTYWVRWVPNNSQPPVSVGLGGRMDEGARQVIRQMLDYLEPWLKASTQP
jgi:hypothetical protein